VLEHFFSFPHEKRKNGVFSADICASFVNRGAFF
jgi:hypothetical protein